MIRQGDTKYHTSLLGNGSSSTATDLQSRHMYTVELICLLLRLTLSAARGYWEIPEATNNTTFTAELQTVTVTDGNDFAYADS